MYASGNRASIPIQMIPKTRAKAIASPHHLHIVA